MRTIRNAASSVRLNFAFWATFAALAIAHSALAQAQTPSSPPRSRMLMERESEQVAQILGLDSRIQQLRALRTQRPDGSPATLEEISIRQDLMEQIQIADLDVESVLAELSNERNLLSDLRTILQSRRDRTVNRLNTAALITGSGLGAIVNATQFTVLSDRTQNIGDGIGVGSGVASTIFSIMAARRQSGPKGSVGEAPNMLAPLFDRTPVLNSYYPAPVRRYLESVAPDAESQKETRLDQLKATWIRDGRLDATNTAKRAQKIQAVSTSKDPQTKVSIDDLTDRIAMLGDVMGRVSLMQRDLALLMHSYLGKWKRE
jgi:hypothetical protein